MWIIVFTSLISGQPQESFYPLRFDTLRDCNLAMFELQPLVPNPGFAECRLLERKA